MAEKIVCSPLVRLIYVGQLKNGKYHGKGKLYDKSTKIKYDGDFVNHFCHGVGKIYDKNGILKYHGDTAK